MNLKRFLLPRTLEIYLTNRCNCNCRYCSSRAIKGGEARSLSFEEAARAIELFASIPSKVPATIRGIGLSGGEPFLEWELVKRVIRYSRKKYKRLNISMCTNGTLLDKDKVEFLLDNDIDLAVSLDGPKKVNDCNRKFLQDRKTSVYETVMDNLERLPPGYVDNIRAVSTFTSRTIHALTASVKFLSGFGFKSIELGLNVYEMWNPEKLKILKNELSRFKEYYLSLQLSFLKGNKPPRVSFDTEFIDPECSGYPAEFAVSVDGCFLPCDTVWRLSDGYKDYAIGELKNGFNPKKLKEIYSQVLPHISEYGYKNNILPPVERYFYAVTSNKDPRILLKNGARVSKIFDLEIGHIMELERILNRTFADRSFGDFEHRSKYISNKEIKTFRLRINSGKGFDCRELEPGQCRQALDFFLYSPGSNKELIITGSDIAGRFGEIAGLILYALTKSGHLARKVKIRLEGWFGRINTDRLRFIGKEFCGAIFKR